MVVRGAVVLRNRGSAVVAVLAALATLATIGLAVATTLPGVLVEYPIVVLLAAVAAHFGWWKPNERPAEIRVDGEGVHIDGQRVRRELKRAVILPRKDKPPIVELGSFPS